MFGSSILEVAIGVTFVYLLLSLICSALNEAIASLLQKRGRNLFEGVKNLLNDPTFTGLAQQVYNHGLISGISQYASDPDKQTRRPSYMSPENFSLALLDILEIQGVISKEYGDLLAQAESADDAYEEASRAASAGPGNPGLAEALEVAKNRQKQTRAALDALADKARISYETAAKTASGSPGDAQLAKLALDAKMSMDHITAALGMLEARRAAIASAQNPKEMALALNAGAALRRALELGRTIAAQYPDPLGNIQNGLMRLPEGHSRESLLVLVEKTRREVSAVEHQAEAFRKNIALWFHDAMNRVSGWYKRWTQHVLLALATVIVLVSNVDTVMLIQRLIQDNALRASLVTAAQDAVKAQLTSTNARYAIKEPASGSTGSQSPVQEVAKTPLGSEGSAAAKSAAGEPEHVPAKPVTEDTGATATGPLLDSARIQPAIDGTKIGDQNIKKLLETAENLKLPIGWTREDPRDTRYLHFPPNSLNLGMWINYLWWLFSKLFGLAISVFAISLGAPFWFDTLSKVVNVRSAGTPPGEAGRNAPHKNLS